MFSFGPVVPAQKFVPHKANWPPDRLPKHMARQVLNFDPRQNQKATIRNHLVQIFFSCAIAPANPPIARLNAPSRGAESQPSQPLPFSALDQIAQLRSAKRPRAQIMITLHQLVPAPSCRALSALDSNQLHRPQFSQRTLDRLSTNYRSTRRWLLATRPWLGQGRQVNHSTPMQSRKRNPATHLLKLTVGAAP